MRFFDFLYIILILNIMLDAVLTKYAMLIGGFYETNNFTNNYGIIIHAIILFILWTTVFILIKNNLFIKPETSKEHNFINYTKTISITFMTAYAAMEIANNIISIILLIRT